MRGSGNAASLSIHDRLGSRPRWRSAPPTAARAAAIAALGALFDPRLHDAPTKPQAPGEKLDRRALLIGRRGPPRGEEAAQ
jgi:hypothetical protein